MLPYHRLLRILCNMIIHTYAATMVEPTQAIGFVT